MYRAHEMLWYWFNKVVLKENQSNKDQRTQEKDTNKKWRDVLKLVEMDQNRSIYIQNASKEIVENVENYAQTHASTLIQKSFLMELGFGRDQFSLWFFIIPSDETWYLK